MVTKLMNIKIEGLEGFVLAKKLMVTKQIEVVAFDAKGFVLAKKLMVTKQIEPSSGLIKVLF